MLMIISQYWLDLLVIFSACSMVFIGWVSVKRFQFHTDFSSIGKPLAEERHIVSPPVLSNPLLTQTKHVGSCQYVLKLQNSGKRCWYHGLSILSDVSYSISTYQQDTSSKEVRNGEDLVFVLEGKTESLNPLHFNIIFSDDHGKTYSQEVVVSETENTRLETPVNLYV